MSKYWFALVYAVNHVWSEIIVPIVMWNIDRLRRKH